MWLYPLLSNQPFSPETKEKISLVFENVCESLGLKVQDDPATRLVAEKIIALAKRDINDLENLRDMTLREFGKDTSVKGTGCEFMVDGYKELGIKDPSGLSDADWVEINKLRDAYKTGGRKALKDAWRKLTDDPMRTVRVYGAFFPDKLRNTVKDVMAAEGITLEDLKDIMEKAKSATH